ncbi:MAG TPA: DUF222 domain-containing protein [Nocardioidaceae bacterium]|nr:DUF222 domain-containing protein [Nocardioidaceae bacterium]
MSVEQLHRPLVAPQIASARAAVESAARVPAGALDGFELGEAVAELAALEAQVAALRLAMLAEADARDVAEQTGDTGTDAWAARLTGSTRGVMAGGIWLAKLLAETFHATRDAFARGAVNEAQVRVIVQAAVKMPAAATAEQRTAAEEGLVAKAVAGMNARRLRQAARRMLEAVSKELADEQEADQLEGEEQRAEVETWLSLRDNEDGTVSGRFVVPELHAHLLRAALERLSAPRRWSRNRSGEPVEEETFLAGDLNYTERLGVAFTELLEHLPAEGHGSVGATVMVHIAHEHLRDGLASARLDTGVRVSAGQARRLACNAGIVPVVLGGDSEVLDQGRARRLHTTAQRRALSVTYDSCAAEGCERPFAWCEIHHPHAWSAGGTTSLDNAIPLCGHHHRRAHDDRFTMTIRPTGEARYRRRRVAGPLAAAAG